MMVMDVGICAVSQGGLGAGNVFRRVYAEGVMVGSDDVNCGTVLEGAKLFELFGSLEGGGSPTDELHEEIAPVAVDADVPERSRVES